MTKFTLSTYLVMSVLIILFGILWILFMQMDRNYQYPSLSADLLQEQNEIFQRVYQLQTKKAEPQQALTVVPNVEPDKQPHTKIIKPVSRQVNPQLEINRATVPANQYNDIWSSAPKSEYETEYFLRNNPWSPDYKLGY